MPGHPISIHLFSYGGGKRRNWEGAFREEDRLRAELKTRGLETVHVLLSAHVFHDPDACEKGLNIHTGRHPRIIGALVDSDDFLRWIQEAMQKISAEKEKAIASGNVFSLSVVVFCKSGKHRSVAACIVLRHILCMGGVYPFLRIQDPIDLSCREWGPNCCRGVCPECLSMDGGREAALNYAYRKWMEH